jgi:hypothetical protein
MGEYRKGFCVEMVTSGCKCQPLSVYESECMGACDFHNMTNGLGLHGVGGDMGNDGVCPKCQQPVVYNRYLVVTTMPPKKPTIADAAPALLAALKELVDYDEGSSEEETYGLEVWQRCKAVIATAEGRE